MHCELERLGSFEKFASQVETCGDDRGPEGRIVYGCVSPGTAYLCHDEPMEMAAWMA